MKNSLVKIFVAVIVLIISGFSLYAAPGNFDSSFGTGGSSLLAVGFSQVPEDIKILPDGKILLASSVQGTGSINYFALSKYKTDGTPDAGFGLNGVVLASFGNFNTTDFLAGIVVLPDGKIFLAGTTVRLSPFSAAAGFMRFNADGSPDTAFDGDGKLILSGSGNLSFSAIALQPDGKLVIGGAFLQSSMNTDLAAFRFNPDGTPDNSFDGDGMAVASFGANDDYAVSVAIQPDGRIVLAGTAEVNSGFEYDFALARFNPNGSLDTGFDTDGKVLTNFGPGPADEQARVMLLQPDGKIVAGGYTRAMANGWDLAMARYNLDGSLDAAFGAGGKVITSVGLRDDINDLALESDGKLVAATGVTVDFLPDAALVRYYPNGTLDPAFGTAGIVRNVVDGEESYGVLEVQPDGKIITAGRAGGDIQISRYRTTGLRIADFNGDLTTDLSIFRASDSFWWYEKSDDRFAFRFQFGTSTDNLVSADYTGDGKNDIAIFRPDQGRWFILRSNDNFVTQYNFPFGTSGDIPVPADYDGDLKADPAVFRPSSGVWYILNSRGQTFSYIQFGTAGDKPVPADYSGDGKADIAIVRTNGSSLEWWRIDSSGGQVEAFQFGAAGDTAVPGDYTGDGKTDIAVRRPSNGTWYFLQVENKDYSSFPFGIASDIPVPGDYDGDGRVDVAVFRQPEGRWYIEGSSSGYQIRNFGLPGDTPIPGILTP